MLAGSAVQEFVGSLVHWFAGSLVYWFVGSLAQELASSLGLLVLYSSLVCWFSSRIFYSRMKRDLAYVHSASSNQENITHQNVLIGEPRIFSPPNYHAANRSTPV